MNEWNNISEELNSLQSHLGSLPRNMPYATPEDYFAALSERVLHALQGDAEATPATWSKANPYQVPEGYFDMLGENILTGEITLPQAGIEPALAFRKTDDVPEGYFESLPNRVLQAVKHAEGINEETKKPQRRSIVWRSVRWAAAAVVILGIGIGGYNMYQRQQADVHPLAGISTQAISDYVQQNIDDFDTEMLAGNLGTDVSHATSVNQLNDKDIEQYLNETGLN